MTTQPTTTRPGFSGKVAFITGASSGIGRATALAFAREGAHVAIADVLADAGRETVRLAEAHGARALFVSCDVSSDRDVRAALGDTIDAFGRLDYAFNNAGVEGQQPSTDGCTEENWDRVLAINLKGVWLCMKHEILLMQAQGAGAIVNCSRTSWGACSPLAQPVTPMPPMPPS